jgi:hypothetical protein
MSVGDEPAMAPTLLSEVPSNWIFCTVQPPALGVAFVADVGSSGSPGVGVGQVRSGRAVVAMALAPVTANIGVTGFTCLVSQVNCRQPRPKLCWMLLSSE